MRPIKFRVLFEVTNRDFTKSILSHYTSLERLTDGSDNFDYQAVKIISKDQFTGLTDKNGVDIYEGDIVKDDMGYNRLITIDSFGVDAEGYDSGDHYFGQVPDTFPWAKFEVIGNEHQSPELMESK